MAQQHPPVGASPVITQWEPNYYKGDNGFCPTIYWTVRNADQILVIEEGSVTERGTHDELLALNGSYARMHRIQTTSIGGVA